MASSFGWGLLASSSLLIGGAIAVRWKIGPRLLGSVMAFGSGVLISAVAFDLVEEAYDSSHAGKTVTLGLLAGCAVFFAGDLAIDHFGGAQRKNSGGAQASGSGLAILLGTVLDGIPESAVLGLTLQQSGKIGAAYLIAVFISNLPEAVASTTGLRASGWSKGQTLGLWLVVMLVSGLASLAGYALFQNASPSVIAFVLTFAGGAILTMLADTMMPEAFEHEGKLVGVITTVGFALAYAIHVLD